MNRKSPIEMEKDRVTKITRAIVRLKHSLAADEELNEILPDRLNEFDDSLQSGELKQLTIDLEEVINAYSKK